MLSIIESTCKSVFYLIFDCICKSCPLVCGRKYVNNFVIFMLYTQSQKQSYSELFTIDTCATTIQIGMSRILIDLRSISSLAFASCATTIQIGIEPLYSQTFGLFRQWLSPHQIKKTRLKNCASTIFNRVFSFDRGSMPICI